MSYVTSDGEPLFNYDEIWEILKAAGELKVPALISLAFGEQPPDQEILADLNDLRNALASTHELIPSVDRAISSLHGSLQP